MENASKALIIAGAILLSISIIGIGMYIFQQASGAMKGAGLDQEQVNTYNEPFERYEGTKPGAEVIQLCNALRTHNVTNSADPSKTIQIVGNSTTPATTPATTAVTSADVNAVRATIQTGRRYTVTLGYDPATGYIVGIAISAPI